MTLVESPLHHSPRERSPSPPFGKGLAHVDTWIFDLDNTLYPSACDLFGQMDGRMTAYVARIAGLPLDEARALQKSWFHEHGTTMAGLMRHHGIDPHEYLADVHDIDLAVIAEDRQLVDAIGRLPGRKLIFTNADAPYARRVLDRLGLSQSFEAIHDIHACAYEPKPTLAAYRSMIDALGVNPATAVFVEDMARNLKPAKALGMTTVWYDSGVAGGSQGSGKWGSQADFIDYEARELAPFLRRILGEDQ